jgi:hypothetical protein
MLLLAGALTGCVETTQEKNARLQLQDDRLLASRSPVRVTSPDPNVNVLKVRTLRARSGTAVAVTLRNEGTRPVSDLPISVTVKTRSGRIAYLNGQPELAYFQTHVAGVAGSAEATWVFTTQNRAPAGAVFARVGAGVIPIDSGVTKLPMIASSVTSVRSAGSDSAIGTAQVSNRSGVAQAGLVIYAYATSGERLLTAGTASAANLGSGARTSVQIPLLGSSHPASLQLQIPPTNLR